ncbi:hypothetical protein DRQ33_07380, partial [bacterium]
MKNKTLLLVCLFAFAGLSFAGWERTYGGSNNDRGFSIIQTMDGGYIVTGNTESFGMGGLDVYVLKLNEIGDTIWTRTYGGSDDDAASSIVQTTDGGYIVAGVTHSFGVGTPDYANVYLLKINIDGDTTWTRTYGGGYEDGAFSVVQTTDNGYIVAGIYGSGAGNGDVYLLKLDAFGDTIWTKTYGGDSPDWGSSVVQTTDGGYIIAGSTFSYGIGTPTYPNVYVLKLNASGIVAWARNYGGSSDDGANSVVQTTDGGYLVTGGTFSSGMGNRDFYSLKLDAYGNVIWSRTYGDFGCDEGRSVIQSTDGRYFATGYIASAATLSEDACLVELDTEYGFAFPIGTYGGSNNDRAYSVIQTADDGLILAGFTESFGAGDNDVYVIKIDSVFINHPPEITSEPPESTVYVDSTWEYIIIVDDADGDSLTFDIESDCDTTISIIVVDDTTGYVSWIPDIEDTGICNIIIIVCDEVGACDTQEFTIEVLPNPNIPLE